MSDTFQSVFMCPPEPKNDSRYVCCALGMPGNARRAWVALPAARAAAYPRTAASTALRSAALGPDRTVPAGAPPSRGEAAETVPGGAAGPGVTAAAGGGLGAGGVDSALRVAGAGGETDSGGATGAFVLLPRPLVLPDTAGFFPPAGFGSGRLSASAGSGDSWE